jgi:Tol biopolymer transport system component
MLRCISSLPFAAPATLLLSIAAVAQTTTREHESSIGVQGNSGASFPALSADGRFIVFRSQSTNLVPGDTNGETDVFVRDRQTGQTTRVSVDSAGVQANGDCSNSDISADGRFVVFDSAASNLVAGDTNNRRDIFLHDRQTAQTTRVSLGAAGQQAVTHCARPSVSADGRFIAFECADDNFASPVPGDVCIGMDVFVRDRLLATTLLASPSMQLAQVVTPRFRGQISDDGGTVVFESIAVDLVPNDNNNRLDAFVWSRATGQVERASLTTGGLEGNHDSGEPRVTADGRYVVFSSRATNFGGGSGPGNGDFWDVFVRDRQMNTTECVSLATGGVGANDTTQSGSITDDARFITFWSAATNLVANDTNAVYDCFLRDRQNGTTIRVSLSAAGIQGRSQSWYPSIAANGTFIAFNSSATNLVIPDNTGGDVFVRDLAATATALGYGTPCVGTSPIPAQAEGMGQPFVGNTSFAVGVCNGFPSRPAVLAMATSPASVFVGPCEVALGGSVTLLGAMFTDIFGFTSTPVPIPANPTLAGLSVFAQYLVFDPNGLFLGFAQLTQGLTITLN